MNVSHNSDSSNAINVFAEGVEDTTIRPIDPKSARYAGLLKLKKLLDEQKQKELEERRTDKREKADETKRPGSPPSS
ncbi:MAG: hypothetical protein L0215_02490 [Gemmataceae bacterium]|nr:hypothetical protein [Gemmataceae bacterium]